MNIRLKKLLTELGLVSFGGFLRDRIFILAVLAGLSVVFIIRYLFPDFALTDRKLLPLILFNSLIWFPVLEELLFRGVIQGQLLNRSKLASGFLGLSYANWITSMLFVAMHFVHHPPLWAVLVIVPSLVFGFMREYYRSTYPAIMLHSIYNAGYLLVPG